MRIISNKALVQFSEDHPSASLPLQTWRKLLEKSSPNNFAELRAIFPSVDRVGSVYVFNIKGNDYRLVCGISFQSKQCYIKHVMTHADYDRGKWK